MQSCNHNNKLHGAFRHNANLYHKRKEEYAELFHYKNKKKKPNRPIYDFSKDDKYYD